MRDQRFVRVVIWIVVAALVLSLIVTSLLIFR
jgi:hypothetical protein